MWLSVCIIFMLAPFSFLLLLLLFFSSCRESLPSGWFRRLKPFGWICYAKKNYVLTPVINPRTQNSDISHSASYALYCARAWNRRTNWKKGKTLWHKVSLCSVLNVRTRASAVTWSSQATFSLVILVRAPVGPLRVCVCVRVSVEKS